MAFLVLLGTYLKTYLKTKFQAVELDTLGFHHFIQDGGESQPPGVQGVACRCSPKSQV